MGVIAFALVAVAAVLLILSAVNRSTVVDFPKFIEFTENAQYYKTDDNGNPVPNQDAEGNVISAKLNKDKQPLKDGDEPLVLEGYYVKTVKGKDGKEREIIVKKVTDSKGKETEQPLIAVFKVNIGVYSLSAKTDYGTYKTNATSFYGGMDSNSTIYNMWKDYGVSYAFADPNANSWVSSLFTVLSLVVVCVVFYLIIRSTTGGAGKITSFAKTKARVSTNIKVRFTDVAGAEEEKVELAEIVEFLRQPKKFSDLGARIPKGVLLVGPPGTGKTLFAKAVAGEAGVPFFSVSGSDFVEMYVGVGASRVRDLFEMAHKSQPCIIFIDEIDAVGRHRGAGLGGGNDEREQTLNQILVQMDGFEASEGVIVMAATNRADILDPALTRPGRFDRQVYVNLPDVKGREQILKVHARNKPLAPDVNFKTVARLTVGFSGADLANLLNEAAIFAARADKKFITNAELFESIDKVTMGPAKKSKVVTESEKRLTAFHESGHCILAKLCKNCDPVHEVTIIPRGNAGGFTMMRPESDRAYYSRNYMLDDICMGLGGRVAEELVIKDISSGAMGDIKQATKFARAMVTEFGMSDKLGLISYSDDSQPVFLGKDMATHNAYSEETAKMIDDEVREIIATQHERARQLLSENRSVLDNMARVLMERETIFTEEVDMLMAGKTYAEVIKFMDEQDERHADNPFKRFES